MIALVLLSGCAETIWGRQMDCAGVEQFDISGNANLWWGPWSQTDRSACELLTRPITRDASMNLKPKTWSFDGYGEMSLTTNDPIRLDLTLPD